VLIIDDEPFVLRVLSRLLQRDYDVLTLSSPREALRRIAAGEEWSCILSDMMMLEMSGLEFARRAGELKPELLPRIAFITGGPVALDEREALRQRPFPVLYKPFEAEALRALVASLTRAAARAPPGR
jgi:CheY-like chemotaxis protein